MVQPGDRLVGEVNVYKDGIVDEDVNVVVVETTIVGSYRLQGYWWFFGIHGAGNEKGAHYPADMSPGISVPTSAIQVNRPPDTPSNALELLCSPTPRLCFCDTT